MFDPTIQSDNLLYKESALIYSEIVDAMKWEVHFGGKEKHPFPSFGQGFSHLIHQHLMWFGMVIGTINDQIIKYKWFFNSIWFWAWVWRNPFRREDLVCSTRTFKNHKLVWVGAFNDLRVASRGCKNSQTGARYAIWRRHYSLGEKHVGNFINVILRWIYTL